MTEYAHPEHAEVIVAALREKDGQTMDELRLSTHMSPGNFNYGLHLAVTMKKAEKHGQGRLATFHLTGAK